MTDKGYYDPARANGHDVHEGGLTNGHDRNAPVVMFDSTPVSSPPIAEEDEAAWDDRGEDALEDAGDREADETAPDAPDAQEADEPAANGVDADAPEPEADETGDPEADVTEPDVSNTDQGQEAAAVDDAIEAEEAETAAPEFTDEERWRHLRMGEALLFASAEPLRTEQIAERLPDGADVERVLADLADHYADRGVSLMRVAGGWAFRTASDLSFLMERERVEQRKLSRAALETLAIIAYHQPVTRAEIEDVRGVSVSKGTLDVLMEIGWVRVRGRRQTPGRPVTYGTSDMFLEHFGLDRISDLPGLDELKAAGLLDTRMPTNIHIPRPSDEDETADVAEEEEESLYARDDEVDDDRLASEAGDPGADEGLSEDGDSLEDETAFDEASSAADGDVSPEYGDPDPEEILFGDDEGGEGVLTGPDEGPDADVEDEVAEGDETGEVEAGLNGGAPDAGEARSKASNGANGVELADVETGDGEQDWPSQEDAAENALSGSRESRT